MSINPARRFINSPDEVPRLEDCGGYGIEYIEPWLATKTVTVLWGKPECGKSSLASKVLKKASQHRRCLILDRENPYEIVRERFNRLHIDSGPNLIVWGRWNFPGPLNVSNPESAAKLRKWVKSCTPGPIILLDSWLSSLAETHINEDKASEVRPYLDRCRDLAFAGATIIILHHGIRDGSRFRGSGDLEAGADAVLRVTNSSSNGLLDKITLKGEKGRLGFHDKLTYRYADGTFLLEAQPDKKSTDAILTALLKKHPGILSEPFEQLAMNAKVGRDKARDFLKLGSETGLVLCSVGDCNAKSYRLAQQAQPEPKPRAQSQPATSPTPSRRVSLLPSNTKTKGERDANAE